MRARARRLKRQHGLGLLVVDYLQLLSGTGSRQSENNRVNEVSEITRGLKAIAKELLGVLNGTKYFFWSGNGQPRTITQDYGRYIRPIFKAAGLDDGQMKAHRLRDTFAVDLLEKGVSLEDVSKLLGHTSIKTTEKHYAKWVKARQDRLDLVITTTWKRPRLKSAARGPR